jgi:hypothetical protein
MTKKELALAAVEPKDQALIFPPSLSDLFKKVEQAALSVNEVELSGKIGAALPKPDGMTPQDKKACWAESSAFNFAIADEGNPSPWNTYFAATGSGKTSAGDLVFSPDAREIDARVIDYWEERARSTTHPVLKARYADLAWDFARLTNKKTNVEMARIAQAAYLDIIERELFEYEPDAWDYIDRAITLSLSIGDKAALEKAKAVMFSFYRKQRQSDEKFMWWRIDDIISDHKKFPISDDEFQEIMQGHEETLARAASFEKKDIFDPHRAQSAADRLANHYLQAGRKDEAVRVIRTAGQAFERVSEEADGLLAVMWLEDVARKYHEHGLTDDYVRVQATIKKRAPDARAGMQRVESRIEIDKNEFDAWIDAVITGEPEAALSRIGRVFVIEEEDTKETVLETAKVAPISAMIGLSIFNDTGMTVAKVGSVENDLDGRAIHQASQVMAIKAPWLEEAFSRLKGQHTVTADIIADFLCKQPFFPADRRILLVEGLNGWLAGDAAKAIHILIPQLEAALRDILAMLGGSIWRPQPATGGFEAIGMGAVLSSREFRERFNIDARFHLRVLFTDQRGLNLRNVVAHGLCSPSLIHGAMANWVVHSLLMIGGLTLKKKAADQGVAAADKV